MLRKGSAERTRSAHLLRVRDDSVPTERRHPQKVLACEPRKGLKKESPQKSSLNSFSMSKQQSNQDNGGGVPQWSSQAAAAGGYAPSYAYPPYYTQHPMYSNYAGWGAMWGHPYAQHPVSQAAVQEANVPVAEAPTASPRPLSVGHSGPFRRMPGKLGTSAGDVLDTPKAPQRARATDSPCAAASQHYARMQGVPPKHRAGALAGKLLDADLPALAMPTAHQQAGLFSDPTRTLSSTHTDVLALGTAGPSSKAMYGAGNQDEYLLKLLHNNKRTGARRDSSTDVSKTRGMTLDSKGSGLTRLQQQLSMAKVPHQVSGGSSAPKSHPPPQLPRPIASKHMIPSNVPGPPLQHHPGFNDPQAVSQMLYPHPPPFKPTAVVPAVQQNLGTNVEPVPPVSEQQPTQSHCQKRAHDTAGITQAVTAPEDRSKVVEAALGSTVYRQFRDVLLRQQEAYVQQVWELHRLVQLQKHLVHLSCAKPAIKAHVQRLQAEGFPKHADMQPDRQPLSKRQHVEAGPGTEAAAVQDFHHVAAPPKHRHQYKHHVGGAQQQQQQATGQLSVTPRHASGEHPTVPMGGPVAGMLGFAGAMWGPQGPPPPVEDPPRAPSGEMQGNNCNGSNGTSSSPNAQHGQSRPPDLAVKADRHAAKQAGLPAMPQAHYFLQPSNSRADMVGKAVGGVVPAQGSGGSDGNGSGANGSGANGSGANGSGANGSGTQQGGSCQASNPAAEATAQGDLPQMQDGIPIAGALQQGPPGAPQGAPPMGPLLLSGYASIPPGGSQGGTTMAPAYPTPGYSPTAGYAAAYNGYVVAAAAAAARQGPAGATGPAMDPMMAWYQQQYGQMMGHMASGGHMMGQPGYPSPPTVTPGMYAAGQAPSGGSMQVPPMGPGMRWWQDPMTVFGSSCVPEMMPKGHMGSGLATQSRGANTSETSKRSGAKRQQSHMTEDPAASPYRHNSRMTSQHQ